MKTASEKKKSNAQLIEEANATVRKVIEDIADSAAPIARQAVADATRKEILGLLGISWDRYQGTWSFQRESSSYRPTPLQAKVLQAAQARAEELVQSITEAPITLNPRELKRLQQAYRRVYLEALERELEQRAVALAVQAAATDAVALLGLDAVTEIVEEDYK